MPTKTLVRVALPDNVCKQNTQFKSVSCGMIGFD